MDTFENYTKMKWYLVYENNIDFILKLIVGKSLDAETQIFAILRGKAQKNLNMNQ